MSGELPEKVKIACVAPRFLAVWGIAPIAGRDFRTDEYRAGGPTELLISERYAAALRHRFGSRRQNAAARDDDAMQETELLVTEAANVEGNPMAQVRFVSAGYFDTMQIPIVAGEACRESFAMNTVRPGDPATFAAVLVLFVGAGALASFWPAVRAARVEPMHVRRDE